mgnify:CR=1 FL=1
MGRSALGGARHRERRVGRRRDRAEEQPEGVRLRLRSPRRLLPGGYTLLFLAEKGDEVLAQEPVADCACLFAVAVS